MTEKYLKNIPTDYNVLLDLLKECALELEEKTLELEES